MDFILEFILEVVLEGIFGLTIKNPKVNIRVKTVVFVALTQLFAGFFAFLALTIPPQDGSNTGNVLCGIVALILSVAFLITAVHGHRSDWKQE